MEKRLKVEQSENCKKIKKNKKKNEKILMTCSFQNIWIENIFSYKICEDILALLYGIV